MKFGLHNNSFIPTTGGAERIFPEVRDRAQWLEGHGFDYMSFMDHLWQIPGVGPADQPFLEAWVTLGAVAASTERIQLTTMVSSIGYRNPALLAKMTATLDLVSGGRAILGIGGGWYEAEYDAYGFEFPRTGVRLGQLRDGVKLIKAMWSDERATYEGKHFVARDAILEPKPLQKPRPRVLIGGGGEKVTLRIVAQEADMCNFLMATPEVFAHKRALVEGYCSDIGRDPSEIEYTKLDRLCLAPTAEKADAKWEARGGRLPEGYRSLVGSPEQAVAQLKGLEAVRCEAVFVSCATDDWESLELFASEVMPALA